MILNDKNYSSIFFDNENKSTKGRLKITSQNGLSLKKNLGTRKFCFRFSHRCGLTGEDLNRRWRDPNGLIHPEIFHTKGLLSYVKQVCIGNKDGLQFVGAPKLGFIKQSSKNSSLDSNSN
jgi:hypothetical protein